MKEHVINYNELTDTREVMNAREPQFMGIFIYLVFSMLIVIFFWTWFGEVEDVVKAQGYVLPTKDVSIIRNTIDGYIKRIDVKDGQKVKQGDSLYIIENGPLIVEKNNLQVQIDTINHEIEMLSKLDECVRKNTNLFGGSESEFYYRYMAYKYNYDQLSSRFNETKRIYFREKDLAPEIVSLDRVQTLKAEYLESEMYLNKLKSETLSKIKIEILEKQDQLLSYQSSLSNVEQKVSLSNITAPIDGIVQIEEIVNEGEYISDGIEVLKIVPSSDSNYRIKIAVENRNIGLLKVGQEVKYDFQTFPYQEFGFATGKITYISKDVSRNESMIYRVEGTLKESKLINRKGEEGIIKPGLLCESRIIVRKKKIIEFVLEKLNFSN